jgi:methanogenic corrinoid protein MtbC1
VDTGAKDTDLASGDDSSTRLLAGMEAHLAHHDRAGIVTDALRAVELGEIDIPTLYARVLTPLLDSVGERWHEGESRVWEEHLATGAVMTAIESLYPTVRMLAAHSPQCDQVIVLATPSQEQHVVGLRMVADLFELSGWKVAYLGANVPEPEIVDAVRSIPADAVVMSASTGYQRVLLRHIADSLREELPDVRIWVGGHAFVDEHDGWPDEEILDLAAIRHAAAMACHERAMHVAGEGA